MLICFQMGHKYQKSAYTFNQFNNDVNLWYKELKLQRYSENEIFSLLKRLFDLHKKNYKKKQIYLLLLPILMVAYFLISFETISWHLSAIGRIALIQILPFWDWRNLKNAQCLINRPSSETTKKLFNCDLCETIINVHAYETIDEYILIQKYIELDAPVIFKTGLESWPNDSHFLHELNANEMFSTSYPCNMFTNMQKSESNVWNLMERVHLFDSFFVHFQNCDLHAMKLFRNYTYRPSFLPNIYSPVTYNWLLWNKNYNMTTFKAIDLIEKITMFGQIAGRTHIKLTPRENCQSICQTLEFNLESRESLIFTSLWNVEYKTEVGNFENIAVILEIKD